MIYKAPGTLASCHLTCSKYLPSPYHKERRERQGEIGYPGDISSKNFNWRHHDDKWVGINNISVQSEVFQYL